MLEYCWQNSEVSRKCARVTDRKIVIVRDIRISSEILLSGICWISRRNTVSTDSKYLLTPSSEEIKKKYSFLCEFKCGTFISVALQSVIERVDPFGNGSCISDDDILEENIYAKKFNASYSRQVRTLYDSVVPLYTVSRQ